ncbi:MAG: nitrous oxide reductase family maturation protein NosD [bacterium]|nr:nitrous oxide reductase family maturation protein NosD [bacterium]
MLRLRCTSRGECLGLVAFLLTLLNLFSLVRLEAAVHRVRAGERIAPVLRQAEAGDTVWLEPGEYVENLVIEVPVTLTGDGYPHIRGGYKGTVIHVKAAGTVIEGLRVSQAGTQLTEDMASILVEADSVTVRDNRIDEPLHGIYVKGASRIHIDGNRIEGRLDLIEEDRGNGIHLWNSRDNLIERNEILNVRDGIYFSFADDTRVSKNHIHEVRYGLHYMYSNRNVFEDNLFERNVAGAALMYSNDIRFVRNVFARCRGFRAYGILYQSMDDTRAEQNLILDNSRGFFLNNSGQNFLLNNDVVDNDLAIQLNGDGGGNVIAGNNFVNNLSDLLLDIGEVAIEWTDERGGNYWSGYRGYDLDGDGIGDRPHTIQNVFQVLESDYPEVRFYLLSLAAEVLEIAERTLPILDLERAGDSAPRLRPWANEEVPWSQVQQRYRKRSLPAAAAFLLVSVAPFLALLTASRRRSG